MATSEKKSWLEERSNLEKYSLVAIALLLIAIVLIVLGFSCSYYGNCGQENCVTSGCIQAASDILKSIDINVDPCDNFYEFACGNTNKNLKIPDDKFQIDEFGLIKEEMTERLRKMLDEEVQNGESRSIGLAKKYFKACMNEKLVEEIGDKIVIDLFKSLGGWPVLEGQLWNDTDFEWSNLMKTFGKVGLEMNSFVSFGVGLDTKNTSKRSIQIDQPGFGLSREYLTTGQYVDLYYDLMVNIATQLGADRDFAERELNASLEFEIELAKIALRKEDRRNITLLNNPTSVKELERKYPKTKWLEYFNALLPLQTQIDENEIVDVIVPSFLASFENLIERTPKRVQANYAFWRALMEIISYLPEDLMKYYTDTVNAINGRIIPTIRWKDCVTYTSYSLTHAVSSLYIRKYFDGTTKNKTEEMIKYINDEFRDILKSLEWMDHDTRVTALKKAKNVVFHVGYPPELLDDKILDEFYKDLIIDENKYLQSKLNISVFDTNVNYKRLYEPVNKTFWTERDPTFKVGAYYKPLENAIEILAGILQGRFFNKDRPMYLNFGAIGSIIGHEITHGFDNVGRQLDEHGNLYNWWQGSTEESFLNKVQCIINQYNNFTVKEINETVNGILTQGENIADNGGVKEAYLAYNKWVEAHERELKLPGLEYKPQQLFWISAAMNWCHKGNDESLHLKITSGPHAPHRFRVIGPFSNSPEFSNDFNCKMDSNMNPMHKCKVW